MTHICVGELTIIGSDNGLLPERHQAIIGTNVGILLIGPLGTNFSEILTFSFTKMRLKVLSAKRRPFCLGLNVLRSFRPRCIHQIFIVMLFLLYGYWINLFSLWMLSRHWNDSIRIGFRMNRDWPAERNNPGSIYISYILCYIHHGFQWPNKQNACIMSYYLQW